LRYTVFVRRPSSTQEGLDIVRARESGEKPSTSSSSLRLFVDEMRLGITVTAEEWSAFSWSHSIIQPRPTYA